MTTYYCFFKIETIGNPVFFVVFHEAKFTLVGSTLISNKYFY